MAVCTLDLGNPCFIASCGKQQDDQDFKDGLRELHAKVEENHLSCNRVVQKFWGNKKFIHLQNKIWKYDWAPTGNSSAGRKAWRMVVIVPDPEIEPYRLIAGAIYSKSVMEQLPLRELSEVFACVMKPILVPNTIDTIAAAAVGEFHRVSNGDGQTRSVCMTCLTPVCISVDGDLIDRAESEHRCDLATETSI